MMTKVDTENIPDKVGHLNNSFIRSLYLVTNTSEKMPPASKISAAKRLQEGNWKDDFYISPNFQNKLFCKSREKTLDHSRPEALEKHMTTTAHKRAKQATIDSNQIRRQATLNDAISAAQLRSNITQDLMAVHCLLSAARAIRAVAEYLN